MADVYIFKHSSGSCMYSMFMSGWDNALLKSISGQTIIQKPHMVQPGLDVPYTAYLPSVPGVPASPCPRKVVVIATTPSAGRK